MKANKSSYALVAVVMVVLLCLVACGEKKTSRDDIITTDYEAPALQAPIAMESQTSENDVPWIEDRVYYVFTQRTPADSLPHVTDSNGQEYVDNKVNITVKRRDQTVFFQRTFTKSSFASCIDADYQNSARLEDVRFLQVDGDCLVFSATLNHPGAADDEAIDLMLSINRLGELSIKVFDDDNLRDDLSQGVAVSESGE